MTLSHIRIALGEMHQCLCVFYGEGGYCLVFTGHLKRDMYGKKSVCVCVCARVCTHVGDLRSECSGLSLHQFLNVQPSSLCPSSDKNRPLFLWQNTSNSVVLMVVLIMVTDILALVVGHMTQA